MIQAELDLYTMENHYAKRLLISSQNNLTIIEGMSVAFLNQTLFDLTIYL